MPLRVTCSRYGIQQASEVIMRGGIAVFPTDTVYGIGCDPRNMESVRRIYAIKSRDPSKPLPVLVHSRETAGQIAVFDDISSKMAERFWPGPLTMLLKVADGGLKTTLNLGDKIALRIPNHRCTLDLLRACGMLVGTSANISGHEPFADPECCPEDLHGYDVFVDGGIVNGGIGSTIVESIDGKVRMIREGSLDMEAILGS